MVVCKFFLTNELLFFKYVKNRNDSIRPLFFRLFDYYIVLDII